MTQHLGELLSALLDGEVSSEERSRIDDHLVGCGRCRSELDELASARAAVRSLPLLEVPPTAVSLPVPPPAVQRRFRVWMGAAAAALVLVVGFAALMSPGEPTPLPHAELPAAFVARSAAASSFNATKAMLPAMPATDGGGR